MAGISDGTTCVHCGGTPQANGSLSCADCGRELATLHGERAQWLVPMAPELERIVREEAAKWDSWADDPPLQRATQGDVADWLGGSRVYRALRSAAPELADVTGWRMLDIGGTCLDAIRFLRSGVQRVDQLEVSPASQAVAVGNLEASGLDWRGRVWFHTAPGELLPFEDETFDLVFSRATVHHTDRDRSIPEIARVLKPGGLMVLVENYRSRLMYRLTEGKRGVTGVDRGTDDPITAEEVAQWRGFGSATLYPFGPLWTVWSQTVDKVTQRPRRAIWDLDLKLGGFASPLATQCWIVARR